MITEADQWTLGQLRDALAPTPARYGIYLRRGALEVTPLGFISWRGRYEEVSINWSENKHSAPLDCYAMYERTEEAIGDAMTGYKGGDYIMSRATPVWADAYGIYEGFAVYGLKEIGKDVVILADRMDGW